jgi:hypothetical protein
VPSIWRNQEIIPEPEFANVAGRAGRAFVDVEWLVLHVVWEDNSRETNRAVRKWETLLTRARVPVVRSGLLLLAMRMFNRIAKSAEVSLDEVIAYVTAQDAAWHFSSSMNERVLTSEQWDRDIASLDASILALLEAETDTASLADALSVSLQGSLFSRQLARREEHVQSLLRKFVAARANRIWSQTTALQRKGYHSAGIGLVAGKFLDTHIRELVDYLFQAEIAVIDADVDAATEPIVEFANLEGSEAKVAAADRK